MGNFDGELIQNQGKVKYATGHLFVGELKNEVPNGSGAIIHPDGSRQSGVFLNGDLKEEIKEFHIDEPKPVAE